jgi:hypothetical protein
VICDEWSDFEKMTNRSFGFANEINGHYEIALSVDNYEAVDLTFKEVVSKGAIPVLEPTTEPWGQRTCYISDPEGKLVHLINKAWAREKKGVRSHSQTCTQVRSGKEPVFLLRSRPTRLRDI